MSMLDSLPFVDDGGVVFDQDPFGELRRARAAGPLAQSPQGVLVLGYRDVQQLFRDPRLRQPHVPLIEQRGVSSGRMYESIRTSFATMDGEDHDRLRRLVNYAFTTKAVQRLQSFIAALFEDLLEPALEQGSCDFVADLAKPYALRVICHMLGVPDADAELFQGWADEENKLMAWRPDDPPNPVVWDLMYDYISKLVAERRKDPADDLISALLAVEADGDRLSPDELIWTVNLVLVGGEDTTRCQLALGMNALLEHPDEWAKLSQRPELAGPATEEVARFVPALMSMPKIAGEELRLGEVTIPAGTALFLSIASANRDESVFTQPDRFEIDRDGPTPITFGSGAHYCLGAMLAKMEVREALGILGRRISNPTISGPVSWRPPAGITGPTSLPITFQRRLRSEGRESDQPSLGGGR